MRLWTIGLLAAGLAVAGCDRSDMAAAAKTKATGEPASATAADHAAPVVAASSNAAPAAEAAAADAGKRPEFREVTIPAGTRLPLVLDTSLASNSSRAEQPVEAHLARAITVRGLTALPQGSRVSGVVTDATQSGRVKGRAHLALRFTSVSAANERYPIQASAVGRTAPGTKKKDALEIGAPAAGGALIGALVGGKKGALIGTAAGGGAGTAVVLSTRGKEVRLPRGSALTIQLVEPLTVRIRS